MTKISDLLVMNELVKADSKNIRAFITALDVTKDPRGGIISFGVSPDIFQTVKTDFDDPENSNNVYIAYMIGKKDFYETKDKLKNKSISAFDFSNINIAKMVEDLKKWRKSTGCNNSDEIIYFILNELNKPVDGGTEQI